MGITYHTGDILFSHADMIVIPVNCRGVAGRGLAQLCKQQCSRWFQLYRESCASGLLVIGHPVLHLMNNGRWLIDFPTKDDWRRPSRVEYIEAGLETFLTCSGPWCVPGKTIAFPMLGCGAGGLSWEEVRPVMERYLSQLVCEVLVYGEGPVVEHDWYAKPDHVDCCLCPLCAPHEYQ